MDTAVALVQAYLRVNGYFTVTEFTIVQRSSRGGLRSATDLDILAFRFPGAGRLVPAPGLDVSGDEDHFAPDSALGTAAGHADMIVGEVKEGRAVLNAAATDPAVLRAVFVRFGCCPRDVAPRLAERLIRDGRATLPDGHQVRLAAFGSTVERAGAGDGAGEGQDAGKFIALWLGHVVRFLEEHLRSHWNVLRHEDQKDPALGFLSILEKSRRGVA